MPQRHLSASCVWHISPEVVLRLDEMFGEPTDAYVNGSQVWLRDDGPQGITIEWRLHPVAGFERPAGVSTSSLFGRTAAAIARSLRPELASEPGDDAETESAGDASGVGSTIDGEQLVKRQAIDALLVDPSRHWDGLEAFAAYEGELDHDVEPAVLAAACTASFGCAPEAFGLVDHDAIGDAWEHQQGRRSIIADLFAQLDTAGSGAEGQ